MARRRRAHPLVTLTTDVGWAYAAQMKAVLAARGTAGRILDLAHDLPPHAIREGAFLFRAMAERFPPGTVHLCVVDPGVGGRRAPVAVRCRDGSFLVGPDNGVLSPLAERLGIDRVVRLDPLRLGAPPRVGQTFDGRDLFAPAAARLARGASLSELGPPTSLRPLTLPVSRRRGAECVGEVLHIDRFGNVITSLSSDLLARGRRSWWLRVGSRRPLYPASARTYEELGKGHLGLLPSSFGLIEVSVGEGNAARRLGVRTQEVITLRALRVPPRRNRRAGPSSQR